MDADGDLPTNAPNDGMKVTEEAALSDDLGGSTPSERVL